MVIQAIALHQAGKKEDALHVLSEVLEITEPGGFIRLFLDEGTPMFQLLLEAAYHGTNSDYVSKLLAAVEDEEEIIGKEPFRSTPILEQPLVEPLSQRELEVLQLIADGLSNQEISEKLFLAISTVKGHNQSIFGKLGVQRRTEAIARARELGLL